jgi:hypothetical protein
MDCDCARKTCRSARINKWKKWCAWTEAYKEQYVHSASLLSTTLPTNYNVPSVLAIIDDKRPGLDDDIPQGSCRLILSILLSADNVQHKFPLS